MSIKSMQSSGLISPNRNNPYMYYKDSIKESQKKTFIRTNQGLNFTDEGDIVPVKTSKKRIDNNTNHNHSLSDCLFRNQGKPKPFQQPDFFTQQARSMKLNSDFSSKISCLPGSYTKEVKEDVKPLRRHMTQNTKLNKRTSNNANISTDKEINWFRTSKKITHSQLEESKEYGDKCYLGKRHIHPGIKNQFKSNFSIGR